MVPGKIVKLPWVSWVCEMMGGGYNALYLMACLMVYLQRMDDLRAGQGAS